MSLDQILAVLILVGTMALLVIDRLRYDFAALLGLLAGIVTGVVPAREALRGFSDDIVMIVASAFVISAAIARSGVVETAIRPLVPHLRTTTRQVIVLVGAVALLSAFVKNVAALAIFLPTAFQLARRSGTSASSLLMPMAFGALLGGVMTLVGTSPNIVVSRLREEILGEPFQMFDFLPVGAGLAAAGVVFLTVGWRLLPRRRAGRFGTGDLFRIENYTAEVRVPPGSPFEGHTVRELEELGEGNISVIAIVREGYRRYVPARYWVIYADDILVVEGGPGFLRRLISGAKLELVTDREPVRPEGRGEESVTVEAVVTNDAPIIGSALDDLRLRERYGANLLALSRNGQRIGKRLRRVRLRAGDLVLIQGRADTIHDTLAELGCLPLADRSLDLGSRRIGLPLLIVAAAIVLTAFQIVSVPIAFFGAAVAMPILGLLTPKETYESIQWPILVLLGALIPLSEALRTTGATDLIAGWLSLAATGLPPVLSIGLVLAAAMAVTPFLNNAATVLAMAPIGAGLAERLGLSPDPFLMAVAIGAACDFLTPIGHQCNTLVMGPGGYRFGDYWRLGLPLSLMILVLGTVLITMVWPP